MLMLSKKNLLHIWVLFAITLFFILMFAVPKGYSIGAIIIALTAIITIPILLWKKQLFNLSRADKNLLVIFAVYGVVLSAINFYHHNSIKEYKQGIEFLLAIPIFLLFYKYPIKPIYFFVLLIIATLIGAILGYYNHTHYSWADRATVKGVNTILYASVIQILAFACLLGLPLAQEINNKYFKYIYILLSLLAFFAGVCLSILSYTRGVWLALPFQAICIGIFYFKQYKKIVISFFIIISISMVAVYYIPQTGVKKRINQTFNSLEQYKKGNSRTSSGLRLEMYKFALNLAKENPILGTSAKEIKSRQEKIPEVNYGSLVHFHNHYLQNLAYFGIVGLALLIFIYLFSFIVFWKRFKTDDMSSRSLGWLGIMLLVSYSIYSMTDVVFHRSIGLLFYVVMTTTICGAVKPTIQDK